MKKWYVVHSQPSKENLAQKHLCEQGFEAYLPQYKKTRRHARRVEEILSPLFPRYLFVELDLDMDQWRCVNGTRGVLCLLTNNGRPASVPNHIIEELKNRADEDGIVPIETICLFSKGDTIRIKQGPFEGHLGTVDMLDDKRRVMLLLSFLSRKSKVSMPIEAVEAA
jgi:transcriptional antiterminator RfaH